MTVACFPQGMLRPYSHMGQFYLRVPNLILFTDLEAISDLPADAANDQAADRQIAALQTRNAELEQQLQQCRQALAQAQLSHQGDET